MEHKGVIAHLEYFSQRQSYCCGVTSEDWIYYINKLVCETCLLNNGLREGPNIPGI